SCPPVTIPLAAASCVSAARSVAGGQIATVQRGASPVVSRPASFCTSPRDALSPFIFQLPAIRGVTAAVTVLLRKVPFHLPIRAVCPNPRLFEGRGEPCLAACERPCLVSAVLATGQAAFC